MSRIEALMPAANLAVSIAVIAASLALVWRLVFVEPAGPTGARRTVEVPSEPISLSGAPILGSRDAAVGVLVLSDFGCPYCGRFARETLPVLRREFVDSGLVQVAFYHMPIEELHAEAPYAAAVGACAPDDEAFWRYHDVMFAEPVPLTRERIDRAVANTGIHSDAFASCLTTIGPQRVSAHRRFASELGFTGTPSFVLGVIAPDGRLRARRVIAGAEPVGVFRNALAEFVGARP